jgi:regulator of RNase E activity RraA
MGQINVPIQCGGIVVNPGDIIVGDTDGVVVVPRHEAENVLAVAEKISLMDDQTIEWIKAKIPIDEIRERTAKKGKEIRKLKAKRLGRLSGTHW